MLEADDMEITRTINLDEKMIKAYPKVDPNAFAYCDTVLHNIMTAIHWKMLLMNCSTQTYQLSSK